MTEFKERQLLFGIEMVDNICMLYFVDFDTLESDHPKLYHCSVRRSWANDFVPGGLYRMEVHAGRLVQYLKDKEYLITQPYYLMLLERKHIIYDRDGTPFVAQHYYTFEDWRAIMNYHPSPGQRICIQTVRAALTGVMMFLPLLLFLWLCFVLFGMEKNTMAVPLIVVAAIPLTIWGIGLMNTLANQILLRVRFMRYHLLRTYTLRTGGRRWRLQLSSKKKKYLMVSGLVTSAIFLLSLLALFL